MDTAGRVYEAYGEDLAFKPFRLPFHPAGCVHLEDLDSGSTLNDSVGFLLGWGLARLGLFLVVNQWFRNYPVLTRRQNRRGQHASVLTPSEKRWG